MTRTILAVIVGAVSASNAQTIHLVPDLATAEADYRDAQAAWIRNDPDLEKDLLKADHAQMRKRIHHAASLRDDMMAKKETYYALLTQHFASVRTRILGSADQRRIPAEQIRQSLQGELDRMKEEQDHVDSLLRELPGDEQYAVLRQAVEAEKKDLASLRSSIDARMSSLQTLAGDRHGKLTDDPLAQKLDELAAAWEAERKRAANARLSWSRYYKDLDDSLPAASGTQRNPFEGSWVFRGQPGSWTTTAGEPLFILLELRNAGGWLQGTYQAQFRRERGRRAITLAVRGQLAGDDHVRLQWSSKKPAAQGELDLKLGSDGRLSVTRPSSITGGGVPPGTDILARH